LLFCCCEFDTHLLQGIYNPFDVGQGGFEDGRNVLVEVLNLLSQVVSVQKNIGKKQKQEQQRQRTGANNTRTMLKEL